MIFAERKRRTEDSTHIQETETIDNRKVPILLKIYLGNSNNKTNLVLYLFQKLRETFPSVLTSSQTLYLVNFDGTTDRVASQSNERIDFYCNHKDTKMFAYFKFLCDNIHLNRVIIVSSDTDVAVISLFQNVTNLTFLDGIWFKTGTGDDQRYISVHLLLSEL